MSSVHLCAEAWCAIEEDDADNARAAFNPSFPAEQNNELPLEIVWIAQITRHFMLNLHFMIAFGSHSRFRSWNSTNNYVGYMFRKSLVMTTVIDQCQFACLCIFIVLSSFLLFGNTICCKHLRFELLFDTIVCVYMISFAYQVRALGNFPCRWLCDITQTSFAICKTVRIDLMRIFNTHKRRWRISYILRRQRTAPILKWDDPMYAFYNFYLHVQKHFHRLRSVGMSKISWCSVCFFFAFWCLKKLPRKNGYSEIVVPQVV